MKKIWDAQNGQAMYAIDETALHNRVINKKQKARRTADLTEKVFIVANILSSAMIIVPTVVKNKVSISGLLMALLMLITAGVIINKRNRRLKSQDNFDKSMLGDLDNAIATADYQVKFSKTSRFYLLSIVILSMTSLLEAGSAWWVLVLVAIFFAITYMAAKWEHRTFYASQKTDLRSMREKLVRMENEGPESSIDDML
ncbi:hypothetical protein [Roseivirga sp.]|uniref:hypothetical protein n=1 Tax=Roseivirga sp. TaxID=1964215 RepID=UPI003B8E2E4E